MFKNYVPKNQRSTIQNYLYPKMSSNMNFNAHLENISRIHKYEEKKKERKIIEQLNEEEKIKQEENLYKLKRFENIPSRLEEQTKLWVIKEAEKRRPHHRNFILNNNKNNHFISPYYDPNGDFSKNKNVSSFDKYYSERIKDLKKNHNQLLRNNNSFDRSNYEDNNDNYINRLKNNKSEILNSENIENQIFEKEELPNEKGIILPKINQNYLRKNIEMINKIPKKNINKKEEIFTHKNYGKTPNYLKQFQLEEIKKKEYEKLLEEESHYPKGTKLIPESERINTLNALIYTKKEIENILEKMPITKRSQSIQDKKEELEKKLNQIEQEIQIFSKKKVFVKND